MAYHFSKTVAFRSYCDFAILVDSERRLLAKLNASAGSLLEKLDAGGCEFSPQERRLVDDLISLGVLCRDGDVSPPPLVKPTPDLADSQDMDTLLEHLNGLSTKALIPLHAHLELTHRCLLSCRHCYLEGNRVPKQDELSLSEIESLLDALARIGTLFLTLSGGEPFLREDLEQIVLAARQRRFAVSLLTSGFQVCEGRISRLAELGLDSVQVSLHGSHAQQHEAVTQNSGSFDDAWKTLLRLQSLGVQTRAAVTVHKENLLDLEALRTLLQENGLSWNPVINLFPKRDGCSQTPMQIDGEDFKRIFLLLPARKSFRLGRLKPEDPPCRAGRATLSIGPSGLLYPCVAWPVPFGSFRAGSIQDNWRDSSYLAEIRTLTLRDLPDCEACAMRSTCNRCTGLAVQEKQALCGYSRLDCMQAEEYARRVGVRTTERS